MTNKLLDREAFAGSNSSGGAACRTGALVIWLISEPTVSSCRFIRSPISGATGRFDGQRLV